MDSQIGLHLSPSSVEWTPMFQKHVDWKIKCDLMDWKGRHKESRKYRLRSRSHRDALLEPVASKPLFFYGMVRLACIPLCCSPCCFAAVLLISRRCWSNVMLLRVIGALAWFSSIIPLINTQKLKKPVFTCPIPNDRQTKLASYRECTVITAFLCVTCKAPHVSSRRVKYRLLWLSFNTKTTGLGLGKDHCRAFKKKKIFSFSIV